MRNPGPGSIPADGPWPPAALPPAFSARPAGSLEPLWSQEVEEMEQLLQVVLQGRPRQQQLVIDLVAVQDPEELRGEQGP